MLRICVIGSEYTRYIYIQTYNPRTVRLLWSQSSKKVSKFLSSSRELQKCRLKSIFQLHQLTPLTPRQKSGEQGGYLLVRYYKTGLFVP